MSFSGSTELTSQDSCFGDIIGKDDITGFDWQSSLETGMPFGKLQIYYEGGNDEQRSAAIVGSPTNSDDPVLRTEIVTPNVPKGGSCDSPPADNPCMAPDKHKARIPVALRNNADLHAFSYRVDMRLGKAFNVMHDAASRPDKPVANHWLTVAEFWNNLPSEPYPFRITLGIHAHPPQGLVWILKGDKLVQENGSRSWVNIWPRKNTWRRLRSHAINGSSSRLKSSKAMPTTAA